MNMQAMLVKALFAEIREQAHKYLDVALDWAEKRLSPPVTARLTRELAKAQPKQLKARK